MENLNTILGINLHTASIFDINEEKLLLLKSEDYYTKSDLFFFMLVRLNLKLRLSNRWEDGFVHFGKQRKNLKKMFYI